MKLEDIKTGMKVRVDNLSKDAKDSPGVVERMEKMRGKEFVVTHVGETCVSFEGYSWTPEWLEPADGSYLKKIEIDGVENMIDEEKKFVEAGIEVDEERLKEEREALVESLRAEFWEPRIGGQILFMYGPNATEGTLLSLSPSRARMEVEFKTFVGDDVSAYILRKEWVSTNSIVEFLPNKE